MSGRTRLRLAHHAGAVGAAPWLILLGFILLLAWPPSRGLAEGLLQENRPVELLTFLTLLWAAALGASLSRSASRHGERFITVGFYGVFGVLAFVVAMEEIAWGQQFLPIETPDFIAAVNVQGELTLHNIQGHNSALEPFLFGMAGLAGVALSMVPALWKITPPPVMLSWFLAIAFAGGADAFTDQSDQTHLAIYILSWIGEVVEMLVGIASMTYLWLKKAELESLWGANGDSQSTRG